MNAVRRVFAARASDVPDGRPLRVTVEGRAIALCRAGESWYAVEDRCSHDNGTLSDGEVFGAQLECPRHGARFSLETGRALTLPAVRAVQSYRVLEEAGDVYVELP